MTRKGDSTRTGEAAADIVSYEDARAELAAIVAALESGNATLEESLALWERGELLAAACMAWLDGAQARMDDVQDDDATSSEELQD